MLAMTTEAQEFEFDEGPLKGRAMVVRDSVHDLRVPDLERDGLVRYLRRQRTDGSFAFVYDTAWFSAFASSRPTA